MEECHGEDSAISIISLNFTEHSSIKIDSENGKKVLFGKQHLKSFCNKY